MVREEPLGKSGGVYGAEIDASEATVEAAPQLHVPGRVLYLYLLDSLGKESQGENLGSQVDDKDAKRRL